MSTNHDDGREGQCGTGGNRKQDLCSFGEEFCFLRKTDRSVPGANEFRVTIDVWISD